MKILIVEDNADDRRLLRYNLEHHGCEVIEAADGQEGLEMAKAHKPALIISDALMPKMDGFQFLRAVKTDKNLKEIPFIFYSAVYTGDKEAALATSLGAEAFIIKPKDPEEFWDELLGILEECRLNNAKSLTAELIEEEEEFLRKYSHIVASKLEEKVRELEKAKATVEAKDQEWQTTFDSIGDCITIHDRDFNVLLANKSCERILGASQNELLSRKCFELFHGRKEPHESCPKLNTERTGRPFETEMFEPKLNLWLSIACFPLLDNNGAVRGVVHIARDITQRKLSEEQLQLTAQRLSLATQSALIGIWDLDLEKNVLIWDERMYELYGIRSEDFGGAYEAWEKGVHPDDLVAARADVGDAMTRTGKFHSQFRVVWPDGQVRFIEAYAIVQKSPDGTSQRMIGVNWDISDRKKLDEQLRQAQKMEAIGTLAGGIAHDFNNILSAIIGYGHIMQMKMAKDDKLQEHLDQILVAADRAANLTGGLLAFSRKQVLNRKPVDLNEILISLLKFLHRIIGEDISLKSRVAESVVSIMADRGQIEQILMNLVTNARDAMPDGGTLEIATSFETVDDEFIQAHGFGISGQYALLTVSDSGMGMDSQTRERIFEPFFTTKEVGKGTGLGLSTIYGIVKQHDGFINVYSEPGQGTTFKIYFPLIKAAEQKGQVAVERVRPRGGKETILVAEDDMMLRKLVSTILGESGYRVIVAEDGDDALEKFKSAEREISLVILDVIMPKRSGKEVFDIISKEHPGLRAIFTSGYTADLMHQKGVLDESLDFLFKPVLPSDLLRKVREVLDR